MIEEKPKLAVSSCLIGHEVRFDGGHKNNRYLSDVLSQYFEFVPFCPEMAIGLGTPRPTIRLLQTSTDDRVEAVSNNDATVRYTDALRDYGRQVAPTLDGICGYIFKKDSPSCGMERVKVYKPGDHPPDRNGVGIYSAEIMAAHPDLPVEEEGRLMDPRLRENFLERVFLMATWHHMQERGLSAKALVDFHTAHKFAILAHDEQRYRALGRIIANAGNEDIQACAQRYLSELMAAMRQLTTPKKHANVLMHIMGFFKDALQADDKAELLRLIEAHREGLVPVIVPITLINYFRRKYPNAYIDGQTYLEPHPPELMLRNML